MTGGLTYETRDGVLVLTLGRPARRNALSLELLGQLAETLSNREARAAVITGAGGAFSSGADLNDLDGTEADRAMDEAVSRAAAAILDFPGPVAAAIEGACVGAAVDLVSACDLRIASESAFFEVPAARLGILYNPAAILRMTRRLGSAGVRRLLLLGERLPARAALEAGLVARVVAEGTALAETVAMAQRAAAGSAKAIRETKRLLGAIDDGTTDLAPWEPVRLDFLRSPERAAAIEAAKTRRTAR